MIKTHKALIACHECGHIYASPALAEGRQLKCQFCGYQMLVHYKDWYAKTAAFTLAGVILFVVSNTFPFMGLEIAGQLQSSNLLSGIGALINRDQFMLAALVFITIFLFPLVELCSLGYILLLRAADIKAAGLKSILRLLHLTRPWSMLEIFLVGALVASVKLHSMADVEFGPGIFAFMGLVVMLIASRIRLNRHDLWDWLEHENFYAQIEEERVVACHCCDALIGQSLVAQNPHCPRCNGIVQQRVRRSVQKTAALLVAAAILYIPANLLTMLSTTELGLTTDDTIFSGVISLAESGDLPIAIIVFVASIVVPIVKIIVMAFLLWIVQVHPIGNPKQQAVLFRVTEFIGRWSMIDVFVVTLLVALVQFGLVANAEPGAAALCFAAVVVLTMLAAETFDPKLIWDAHDG